MKNNTPITNNQTLTNFILKSYNQALEGIPSMGIPSVTELAEEYRNAYPSPQEAAKALVKNQCVKTILSGIALGIPGGLAYPVTLSADLVCSYVVSVRMVAGVAILAGLNPHNDRVRTLIYLTLTGEAIEQKFLRPAAKETAEAFGRQLIKVGYKNTATKAIPIVGGVIGGLINGICTAGIAAAALSAFFPEENTEQAIQAA